MYGFSEVNKSNHNNHSRKSVRYKGYDYSQAGAYFVTICTHQMKYLFGDIKDGIMELNSYGGIAHEEWFNSAIIRTNVQLYNEEFAIMPNHIHGIIWIIGERATQRVAPTDLLHGPKSGSLGEIIGQYKSITTKRIIQLGMTKGRRIWQRNYYDRIIRSEKVLDAIRQYIQTNPQNWESDLDIPIHLIDLT